MYAATLADAVKRALYTVPPEEQAALMPYPIIVHLPSGEAHGMPHAYALWLRISDVLAPPRPNEPSLFGDWQKMNDVLDAQAPPL